MTNKFCGDLLGKDSRLFFGWKRENRESLEKDNVAMKKEEETFQFLCLKIDWLSSLKITLILLHKTLVGYFFPGEFQFRRIYLFPWNFFRGSEISFNEQVDNFRYMNIPFRQKGVYYLIYNWPEKKYLSEIFDEFLTKCGLSFPNISK